MVGYRPLATSLGVLAAELMVIVYASFSLRKRIGVRNWRRLHWATYGIFAAATAHGLAAGTDTSRPWAFALYLGAVGAVAAATAWRAVVVAPGNPLTLRAAANASQGVVLSRPDTSGYRGSLRPSPARFSPANHVRISRRDHWYPRFPRDRVKHLD